MLCDSDNIPMRFLHTYNLCYSRMAVMQSMQCRLFLSGTTDSVVGYLIRWDESIKISSQAQNHQNHVANKSHYTDSLVNPNFGYIDNTLVLRITITNESLYRLTKVIELTKVHLDFRKSYRVKLLANTPPVEIRNPLQWKYELTPPMEI